jgi:nucleotide-binding universal stress UspA family protein
MKGYRKVLIAVNGSREILRQGIDLACDEKCWITVVKVLPANEGDLNLTGVKNIGDVLSSHGDTAASELKEMAEREGVLIKTRLEEGEAHKKILEAAQEERCDVIVMGAQKRSWLRKIFGDNTVEKVISQAPCPVLVLTP